MEDNTSTSEPASIASASLSQYLLAPLDAIFKAQVHAARSFINFLLQIGYRHQKLSPNGLPQIDESEDGKPFYLEFNHISNLNGKDTSQRLRIPALAAIPIAPLSVESAEFSFKMKVEKIAPHKQIQSVRQGDENYTQGKRPWFLVEQPLSIRGTLGSSGAEDTANAAMISVKINVGPAKIPAGLSKFITSLGELASVDNYNSSANETSENE